jgi:hypothetical protein
VRLLPVGGSTTVAEFGNEEVVVFVGDPRHVGKCVHELGVLEVVAKKLVFNLDRSSVPVEEELPVRKCAVPLVEGSQQTELVVVRDRYRVYDARGNVHDGAFPRPSDQDGEARASVIDDEAIVGFDLIAESMRLESEPGEVDRGGDDIGSHGAEL